MRVLSFLWRWASLNPNESYNIFWNVYGLNDQDKHQPFTKWLSTNQPQFGAILETHIKEPTLNQVMLGACPGWKFTSNHDTDKGGRIIVIWKAICNVQVLHQSRQSLTCSVILPGGFNFTYTAVYASNIREERKVMWEELLKIQQSLFLENTNWIIGGDLNQIMHFDEDSQLSINHLTDDMIELKSYVESGDG